LQAGGGRFDPDRLHKKIYRGVRVAVRGSSPKRCKPGSNPGTPAKTKWIISANIRYCICKANFNDPGQNTLNRFEVEKQDFILSEESPDYSRRGTIRPN
jgi:hypothetical protein